MNSKCFEWGAMQRLVKKEHATADTENGFAVRKHGTGYLVTYSVKIGVVVQSRAAFCHLDGMIWDRPCSFPDPEAL